MKTRNNIFDFNSVESFFDGCFSEYFPFPFWKYIRDFKYFSQHHILKFKSAYFRAKFIGESEFVSFVHRKFVAELWQKENLHVDAPKK